MRCRPLLASAVAVALLGCATRAPLPPLLLHAGVTVASTTWEKTVVTTIGTTPLASRLMHIATSDSGGLTLISERGVRRLDGQGTVVAEHVFPYLLFRPTLVTLADGRERVVGYASGTVVMDVSGQELLRTDEERFGYRIPEVANVTGGPNPEEILVPGRMDVRIHDFNGTLLGRVAASRYASEKTVVQADDDPEYELAFVATHLADARVEVEIYDADGTFINRWASPDGGWLAHVPALDERLLWGITAEGFAAWSADGHRRLLYPAADAHRLRYVLGARTDDHVVLVASGDGYTDRSLLCIFDNDQRLVYQEVFETRVYALTNDTPSSVLIGVGDAVLRYRTAR